jgi:methyl-accepting chemotaxis protein
VLASSSQELSAATEQGSSTTLQITQTISQVAEGAQQEVSAVGNTQSSISQMISLMDSSEMLVNNINNEAHSSVDKASMGTKAVHQVINGMAELKTTIESASQIITGLAEKSSEIESVVELISEFADQTNLLALNAAIESARAGEHGRGFAVVAEEVRRLAERSQNSTKNISMLIYTINSDVNNSVSAINSGAKRVGEMVGLADQAGQTLKEIGSSVDGITKSLEEMTTATKQVKAGAGVVNRAIESISAITEETSASSEEVTASAEEQSAVIEEISANAKSLAERAQHLASLISSFKV